VAPHREIHSVKVRYEPDEGPGRYRIGLIVPAEDAVSERDFRLMLPDDSVAIFTNRIETTQIGTVEELKKMAPLLQKVATLVLTDDRLDVLVYSCTSATVAIGYENVASSLVSARAETPVVTPITAALAAFRALQVKKIAVVTPYPDDVNVAMYDYLEEQGAVIRGFYAFKGLLTDYEVSRLPPRAIYEAGLEADNPDVEAVFISCTGIRSVEIADELERSLRKPVVTSNQASFWQCLRYAGCSAKVPGFGRLLMM
jgi:maleate isomerase